MRSAREDRVDVEIHLRVELGRRLDRLHEPDLPRALRVEADAADEERGRVRRSDLANDVRRHNGGDDADADLGEAEHGRL